jgi:hypothetical protein
LILRSSEKSRQCLGINKSYNTWIVVNSEGKSINLLQANDSLITFEEKKFLVKKYCTGNATPRGSALQGDFNKDYIKKKSLKNYDDVLVDHIDSEYNSLDSNSKYLITSKKQLKLWIYSLDIYVDMYQNLVSPNAQSSSILRMNANHDQSLHFGGSDTIDNASFTAAYPNSKGGFFTTPALLADVNKVKSGLQLSEMIALLSYIINNFGSTSGRFYSGNPYDRLSDTLDILRYGLLCSGSSALFCKESRNCELDHAIVERPSSRFGKMKTSNSSNKVFTGEEIFIKLFECTTQVRVLKK